MYISDDIPSRSSLQTRLTARDASPQYTRAAVNTSVEETCLLIWLDGHFSRFAHCLDVFADKLLVGLQHRDNNAITEAEIISTHFDGISCLTQQLLNNIARLPLRRSTGVSCFCMRISGRLYLGSPHLRRLGTRELLDHRLVLGRTRLVFVCQLRERLGELHVRRRYPSPQLLGCSQNTSARLSHSVMWSVTVHLGPGLPSSTSTPSRPCSAYCFRHPRRPGSTS